jgi:pyruvate dehydrogenase E1 component alpha subunit
MQWMEPTLDGLRAFRQLVLLRRFEERVAELYIQAKIAGFTHLYIGQEAVAVGAMATLDPRDSVITAYREHGQALARGCDPGAVMAELFGKATGVSGGRGGSMHLFCAQNQFMGGYAIVGSHLPLATGLALAKTRQEDHGVVVCFFGDGAVNEGAFHESLNLAKIWNLPVIFICENNRYGMGTAHTRVTAEPNIAAHADSYHMPGHQADGMDVQAMFDVVGQAVRRARQGRGPTLVEALTYRLRGHSMADPLKYRTREEESVWQARDPLESFPKRLIAEQKATPADLERIRQEVEREVEAAIAFAESSPQPDVRTLMDHIYAHTSAPPRQAIAAQIQRSYRFHEPVATVPRMHPIAEGEGEE